MYRTPSSSRSRSRSPTSAHLRLERRDEVRAIRTERAISEFRNEEYERYRAASAEEHDALVLEAEQRAEREFEIQQQAEREAVEPSGATKLRSSKPGINLTTTPGLSLRHQGSD